MEFQCVLGIFCRFLRLIVQDTELMKCSSNFYFNRRFIFSYCQLTCRHSFYSRRSNFAFLCKRFLRFLFEASSFILTLRLCRLLLFGWIAANNWCILQFWTFPHDMLLSPLFLNILYYLDVSIYIIVHQTCIKGGCCSTWLGDWPGQGARNWRLTPTWQSFYIIFYIFV